MQKWWNEKDFASALREESVTTEETFEDTVARILRAVQGEERTWTG